MGPNRITGLCASLLTGQGHQGIFFLVKATLQGHCKFPLELIRPPGIMNFITTCPPPRNQVGAEKRNPHVLRLQV